MTNLDRITCNPEVMGGKPCIRGMRVTVGTIVGLMASGHTPEEIIKAYPYLEKDDIYQSLAYAAWRTEETDDLILGETAEKMLTLSKMVGSEKFTATLEKLSNK